MSELPITEELARAIGEHRSQTKRVLMVEDNETDAFLALEGLNDWGYMTTHVRNGEDAILAAERNPYDFAIIDLVLPTMPGETVAMLLSSSYPMMVIVICTGYDDAKKVLPAAFDRQWVLMKKPFDINMFNKIARVTNAPI